MRAKHWQDIEAAIRAATGTRFRIEATAPVGGGCIDESHRVEGTGEQYFVKLGRATRAEFFAAEAAGLRALGQAHGLRVPQPVTFGAAGAGAFLVLEYVELRPATPHAMAALGEALAELHGIAASRFGWDQDNRIGATQQRNTQTSDWAEFWQVNRLGYQLELAGARGNQQLTRAGERLAARLPDLLAGHHPEASLVHGDLWGGNAAMDPSGRPVLFDPAVYHGDRETDLAMTELFGGFPPLFYEAYHGAWPVDRGYREVRRDLYNLYHLLNHDALFGGHYSTQAQRCIERLLAG